MYKERESQGGKGGGCDQRGLKRRKGSPNWEPGESGAERRGGRRRELGQAAPARRALGWGAAGRARAGRAAVTSRQGPLPLAGWGGASAR